MGNSKLIWVLLGGLVMIGIVGLFFMESIPPKIETESKFSFSKLRKEGPDEFFQIHHMIRTRVGDQNPRYPSNYKFEAFQKAWQSSQNRIQFRDPLPWIERGPGNVSGRTRSIIVDPDDPSFETWYVGSAGGGVWKTENAGQSWSNLTEHLPNLSTSILAIAPSNPDVFYLGTGEGYSAFHDITGSGIWKSLDRGETWSQLESTKNAQIRFGNIQRIIVNPDDENEVLVTTSASWRKDLGVSAFGYIHKSSDGGNNWETKFSTPRLVQQIMADPSNFNILYATENGHAILKSMDAGETWNAIYDFSKLRLGRLEMAIAPDDSNIIYVSAEDRVDGFSLYKSTDGAQTFTKILTEAGNPLRDIFNGQGNWDNTIAVNPYASDEVFVGGAGPIIKIKTESSINEVQFDTIINNTEFLGLVDFGGERNGIYFPEEYFQSTEGQTTSQPGDYVDIEMRFGANIQQKVHRFRPIQGSRGDFEYVDYINLPFEVINTENSQPLMVSFLDQNEDAIWSLDSFETTNIPLEAIIVHNIPYDDESPDLEIQDNLLNGALYVGVFGTINGAVDLENVPGSSIEVKVNLIEEVIGNTTPVTDGYGDFEDDFPEIGSKGVHVDHHNLLLIPIDSTTESFYILNANDGGVAFSKDNGQTFVQTGASFDIGLDNILTGLNTAQFYGVDKMNGASRYVGGTQDNGSWVSGIDPDNSSEWVSAPSGDGFEAAWHYQDSLKIIETSQRNSFYRSVDGGASWESFTVPGFGPFVTRIANSKQDPELAFAVSSSGVLRSYDFGASWEVIEMPSEWNFSATYGPPIEISLASPLVVWTGIQLSSNSQIVVSKDGGSTFNPTSEYLLADLGVVTSIATHPTNPATAYATFSMADGPKVLKTTNFGEEWTDLSGFVTNQENSDNGFPDVATYSLLVMPFDTNTLWAGTEIGLFESRNGGITWQFADNGLPPASIWEMKIVNNEVVLATHGRGVWSVALPELSGYEPQIPSFLAPVVNVIGEGFDNIIEGEVALRSPYDSALLQVEVPMGADETILLGEQIFPANDAPANQLFSLKLTGLPEDTILEANLRIKAFKNGLELNSLKKVVIYDVELNPVLSYRNDFNAGQSDFARLGFNVFTAEGFVDPALHSPHPYNNRSTYSSILQIPLIVDDQNPLLTFDEVVSVEIGDSPEFGSSRFYDYVVVEGTNDKGRSWKVLEGYDSSFDPVWETAYNNGEQGNPALVVNHEINLIEHFMGGDTVYLRFRLVSDPFVTGWGWMIDNIQAGEVISSTNSAESALEIPRINIFPNPAKDWISVNMEIPRQGSLKLDILNSKGQKMVGLEQMVVSGNHREKIPLNQLPNGIYFVRIHLLGQSFTKKILIQK